MKNQVTQNRWKKGSGDNKSQDFLNNNVLNPNKEVGDLGGSKNKIPVGSDEALPKTQRSGKAAILVKKLGGKNTYDLEYHSKIYIIGEYTEDMLKSLQKDLKWNEKKVTINREIFTKGSVEKVTISLKFNIVIEENTSLQRFLYKEGFLNSKNTFLDNSKDNYKKIVLDFNKKVYEVDMLEGYGIMNFNKNMRSENSEFQSKIDGRVLGTSQNNIINIFNKVENRKVHHHEIGHFLRFGERYHANVLINSYHARLSDDVMSAVSDSNNIFKIFDFHYVDYINWYYEYLMKLGFDNFINKISNFYLSDLLKVRYHLEHNLSYENFGSPGVEYSDSDFKNREDLIVNIQDSVFK